MATKLKAQRRLAPVSLLAATLRIVKSRDKKKRKFLKISRKEQDIHWPSYWLGQTDALTSLRVNMEDMIAANEKGQR